MAEGTGTGVPEPHQEIEDELSSLGTKFDLARQGRREVAIPSTESQVGIANPNIHQATPSEVVVAGRDFKNVNFGPHTSTSHFEGHTEATAIIAANVTITNSTINASASSGVATKGQSTTQRNKEDAASGSGRSYPTNQGSGLPEGYVRISDDTVLKENEPLRKGTNVYLGYQEHPSRNGFPDKLPVAIKIITEFANRQKDEIKHLVNLASHPNVVRIIQSKKHQTPGVSVLYIVMELCCYENLQDYLKENRDNGSPLDFEKTLKFTKQLVKGMKHIHDNGIVHRDVKPENVLLSDDKSQLKIADFGLGKAIRQGCTSTKASAQGQGTTGYMAPETLSTEKVSKSSDIFSFGVTMFELWSNGLNPYGFDIFSRDSNIINNKPPDLSGLLITGPLGNALLDLIKRMLQHDPRLRPTIDEVLKDIFFTIAKRLMNSGEDLPTISSLKGPKALGEKTQYNLRSSSESLKEKKIKHDSQIRESETGSTKRCLMVLSVRKKKMTSWPKSL